MEKWFRNTIQFILKKAVRECLKKINSKAIINIKFIRTARTQNC